MCLIKERASLFLIICLLGHLLLRVPILLILASRWQQNHPIYSASSNSSAAAAANIIFTHSSKLASVAASISLLPRQHGCHLQSFSAGINLMFQKGPHRSPFSSEKNGNRLLHLVSGSFLHLKIS